MVALHFPEHGDKDFSAKLMGLDEYQLYATEPIETVTDRDSFEARVAASCGRFEKATYQHLIQHYLSKRSPYHSILLYHGLGVGKTCSSITVAESFLFDHTTEEEPRILVVSPTALKKSYEDQIFSITRFLNKEDLSSQCTSDTYAKLIHGNPSPELFMRRMQQLIRSRYKFITYESLVGYVAKNPKVSDKIIIIDEAHNMRQQDTEKKASDALEKLLKNGERNRLILLSATPMYNEPDEILWLLGLLLRNDHRMDMVKKLPKVLFKTTSELREDASAMLGQLASEYISYIRGKNPFTFAARVHPNDCGVPTIQDRWAAPIRDGIVPTRPGEEQAVEAIAGEAAIISSAPKQIQWLNITYPDKTSGSEGFWKLFSKGDGFPAQYQERFRDALMPVPGKLEKRAAKLQTICDSIRKSDGITVVYSRFVWSGILPLAAALEHMGFQRYDGKNLVASPSIVENVATYPGIPFPKYAILCGDVDVMGTTKIEKLMRAINSSKNLRGEEIKVVLITPIAGEGLSFHNIRSVHIMDPWYHMNLIEQVIGRAIRTCSHIRLPLEERNVSIFLHACYQEAPHTQQAQDTADVHAYKIAARKLLQTQMVEKIIRDNAVDCNLLYHINYYPVEKFKFETLMKTSHRTIVPYKFGDGLDDEPHCRPVIRNSHSSDSMRGEVYANLLPTIVRRLEKHIKSKLASRIYFSKKELIEVAKTKDEVLEDAISTVLYPNMWIPGYRFYAHQDGYVFVPVQKAPTSKQIMLPVVKEEKEETNPCAKDILLQIPSKDAAVAIIYMYMSIDSKCWESIAQDIITNRDLHEHANVGLLWKEGLFVHRSEMPGAKYQKGGELIGYVDIFAKDNFRVVLMEEGEFRVATETEKKQLQQRRKMWSTKEKQYGFMDPVKFSKEPKAPYRHQFKLMLQEVDTAKRRGVVCTSNLKPELAKILSELDPKRKNVPEGETKDQMCFSIATEMYRKGLLQLYPLWKPLSG